MKTPAIEYLNSPEYMIKFAKLNGARAWEQSENPGKITLCLDWYKPGTKEKGTDYVTVGRLETLKCLLGY